jgi:hypothetical protein
MPALPWRLIMEVAETLADAKAAQRLLDRRREKDRDQRKRNSADVRGNGGNRGQAELVSPQSPPLKAPPHPLKITPPLTPHPPQNCARKARRLEADWKPEPLNGKAAEMVACWQAGEVERELAKFKNYWFAKGGKDAAKLNWQRTWINWLISADERKPRGNYCNERSSNPLQDAVSRILAN